MDKTAKSVAASSKVLLSDNGFEFNNQILNEGCSKLQIKKCYVLAYHPASDGMVEHQNRKKY